MMAAGADNAFVPVVPAGTFIRFRHRELLHCHDLPADAYADVVVSKVHDPSPTPSAGSVWVSGHGVECGWASADRHPPCITLQVTIAGLQRGANDSGVR